MAIFNKSEFMAAQRARKAAHRDALELLLIDQDKMAAEKEYGTVLKSLAERVETLGLRSPTRLSSNIFWDEYLKTERQVKADKLRAARAARSASAITLNRLAPAATKLTRQQSDSDSDPSDHSSEDSDDSDYRPRKPKAAVVPASAPAGGRKHDELILQRSTTAGPNRSGQGYSHFDPEFDDEHRRRLRNNAMSVLDMGRPDSAAKSHPFIKKLLLAKMEPPKSKEDANTLAMQKKKEEKAKKQREEDEALGYKVEPPNKNKNANDKSNAASNSDGGAGGRRKPVSRARASMAERELQSQQAQLINPLFLDEKTGQEVYRVLIQQEIKWTRQAVLEASRRNRLSSKREFAFFS